LSDLVNTVIPEWGRPMNDNELHAEMERRHLRRRRRDHDERVGRRREVAGLKIPMSGTPQADPDKYLRTFVEEVLRLESPVQALFRFARTDVEIAGVKIPAGFADRPPLWSSQSRRSPLCLSGEAGSGSNELWQRTWLLDRVFMRAWELRWQGVNCTGVSERW